MLKRDSRKKTEENPRVLITGCSSGFGKLLVQVFLRDGWQVIATMRNADSRKSMFVEEQAEYGDQLTITTLDVTSSKDREAVVNLVGDGARLDCLINNAGYALWGALENCSEAQLKQQYDVNLIAPVLLSKSMLPFLRLSKGSVINVSSLMGFIGFPMSSAYCSSKAGLSMVSECLAHELASFGVRVHAVEPGGFNTGFVGNSQWGDGHLEDYESHTSGFHDFQDKLNAGPGNDPKPVADKILMLANKNVNSVRNQVGTDALASKLMQRALPESVRIKLIRLMFRKILQ